MRPKRTGLLGITVSCTCGWYYEGSNGLGLAAQHYDRCGGTVYVEIVRSVIYG